MIGQIEGLFERGELIRPSDRSANLVHLVRTISHLCGVEDVEMEAPARELSELIGPVEHLVFVLLDGLGMNVVSRLPPEALVCRKLVGQLTSTCPSTTACALTTVATAAYPTQHGIVGWFTHLPRFALTATVLPFVERFSSQPLTERGITPGDVVPLPPVAPQIKRKVLIVTPASISQTPFNSWLRAGTEGLGYQSIPDAVDQIISRIREAREPTYTHLYLPEIDSACHKFGVEHPNVVPEVMRIDAELARLCEALGPRARIVISADHGLIDVRIEKQTLLLSGDSLLEVLQVPPTGDARMPIFHVLPEERESFVHQARERFGDRMILLSTDEVEAMELLGPGKLSETTRRRLGDFIGVPFRPATLAFHPANKPMGHLFKAVHGGLSPQEMWVPLSVA